MAAMVPGRRRKEEIDLLTLTYNTGLWMVIGSIAGFILSLIGFIVSRILLNRRWKKLKETFGQEYGLSQIQLNLKTKG